VTREHPAVRMLCDRAAAVSLQDPQHERRYADSTEARWVQPAFATPREALEYEYHVVVREIPASWAPLAPPVSHPESFPGPEAPEEPPAQPVAVALFPKAGVMGYAVLRHASDGVVVLGIGAIAMDADPPSGGFGPEAEAHVGLPVGKWVM
jgi:hypothetical protein